MNKLDEQKVGKNREQIGAKNRENVWEEVPDTFGGFCFRVFQNLENHFSES